MSYYCAVCNGMELLECACPVCGHPAQDEGKLSDFYGPYSPYRNIDDLKLTNGFIDLEQHICVHSIYCPECGRSSAQPVRETNQLH
ncbi:hypothetical protein [Paenibacillus naphthalenovorans]|uniref:hypothetical protein n=1 Tax=Paenibacillus naphthalenovorans TaxID=162209 RepID=UPI0008809D84|nr:hypothetical protein [Paenibacillus naphthalenovorans]SDI45117.1 hypothetical protein SAMN05421868_106191 [Paenibacillus naphthalenovorans]